MDPSSGESTSVVAWPGYVEQCLTYTVSLPLGPQSFAGLPRQAGRSTCCTKLLRVPWMREAQAWEGCARVHSGTSSWVYSAIGPVPRHMFDMQKSCPDHATLELSISLACRVL